MSTISKSSSLSITPSTSSTSRDVMATPPKYVASFSSVPIASRKPPSAWREISSTAGSSTSIFSLAAIWLSTMAMSCTRGRRKSKRWQRDRMVAGILWTSVVASTKTTCGGGSSRVLRRALKASLVSMWASSTM